MELLRGELAVSSKASSTKAVLIFFLFFKLDLLTFFFKGNSSGISLSANFFAAKEAASETRELEEPATADKEIEQFWLSFWLLKNSSKYLVQPLSSRDSVDMSLVEGALLMELIEAIATSFSVRSQEGRQTMI